MRRRQVALVVSMVGGSIDAAKPPNASQYLQSLEDEEFHGNSFFVVIFLLKGKRVNSQF